MHVATSIRPLLTLGLMASIAATALAEDTLFEFTAKGPPKGKPIPALTTVAADFAKTVHRYSGFT